MMTQIQKDGALGFLYLLLEKTRFVDDCAVLTEAWAAATMARFCGLITESSHSRIVRYLDNRDYEIKESY